MQSAAIGRTVLHVTVLGKRPRMARACFGSDGTRPYLCLHRHCMLRVAHPERQHRAAWCVDSRPCTCDHGIHHGHLGALHRCQPPCTGWRPALVVLVVCVGAACCAQCPPTVNTTPRGAMLGDRPREATACAAGTGHRAQLPLCSLFARALRAACNDANQWNHAAWSGARGRPVGGRGRPYVHLGALRGCYPPCVCCCRCLCRHIQIFQSV